MITMTKTAGAHMKRAIVVLLARFNEAQIRRPGKTTVARPF
jgi:hypothetical protein